MKLRRLMDLNDIIDMKNYHFGIKESEWLIIS